MPPALSQVGATPVAVDSAAGEEASSTSLPLGRCEGLPGRCAAGLVSRLRGPLAFRLLWCAGLVGVSCRRCCVQKFFQVLLKVF